MLTLRRAEGAKSKTSCLSNYRFGPFRLNASTSVARNGTLGFAFLQSTQLGCRPHDNITNWFELIFFLLFKRGGGFFLSLFISLTKIEFVGAFRYGVEIYVGSVHIAVLSLSGLELRIAHLLKLTT